MAVAVFHHISEPTEDKFTHSIEQILAFDGKVTFDGVYESVFNHRMALKDLSPILFITGNQIGREGYCNKEQLLELRRLDFTLGWHGWSHRKLTDLPTEEIRAELQCPDWVSPVYAYPHGDFNDLTIAALLLSDYLMAYSTTQGNGDQFSLERVYV